MKSMNTRDAHDHSPNNLQIVTENDADHRIKEREASSCSYPCGYPSWPCTHPCSPPAPSPCPRPLCETEGSSRKDGAQMVHLHKIEERSESILRPNSCPCGYSCISASGNKRSEYTGPQSLELDNPDNHETKDHSPYSNTRRFSDSCLFTSTSQGPRSSQFPYKSCSYSKDPSFTSYLPCCPSDVKGDSELHGMKRCPHSHSSENENGQNGNELNSKENQINGIREKR
ncbi:hypothetical protein HHI36_002759, partial [Cryptolaemus montrouzieri]